MPVKPWNFRKAKWSHYIALTNKFAKTLLPPDSLVVDAAYQDFCNIIKRASKKTIPRENRNNYIPCWDVECESFSITFLQSSQVEAQVWLLQLCLPSLTGSGGIDCLKQFGASTFYSSRKVWSILNNVTGRPRHSPRHCPVSADVITCQLVRSRRYKAVDRKSSRHVSQEMYDLWRATTTDPVNISDTFLQREFTTALQHLKLGKAQGPDSIFP